MTASNQSEVQILKHKKMMSQGSGLQVLVLSSDKKETVGEVRVQIFTSRERLHRCFKFLGLFWGLALVSVLVPLAHFILVPSFFVAGIISIFIINATTSVILGGEGSCPYCGQFLTIVRMADKWPLNDLCGSCKRSVSIEKNKKNKTE